MNISEKNYGSMYYAYSPKPPRVEPKKVNHFENKDIRRVQEISSANMSTRNNDKPSAGKSISLYLSTKNGDKPSAVPSVSLYA